MTTMRANTWRKIAAVLAGGLVLGVGTTATLAAWTDEENATETFKAGTFSIVGSTNGADFSDHPTSPGAALDFTVTPTALVPGTTSYALYSVKTAAGSVSGSVQLTADPDNDTGLGKYLHYGVRTLTDPICDADTFTDATSVDIVGSGSELTVGSNQKLDLEPNGASAINYCFAVSLPTTALNEAQGTTLTGRWVFAATAE
ncbi:SipW-dependent-type signal peptide-containing protein [Paeniglutamicibacter sulfureus]|uniref:Ribosomally synthesized peptide with SipW-like signal peptide n=1 Tax=Paeniglutamicibacter sulfureus TaxID=43666 RepID=A0ABU2BK85_9MICC|nr:SipW-dependent-type signal peptide-containing protein [Paeniglutamicibacter sulfureus]MDR7359060.1 putative ribosomally synthesized peptide with SipW-like signal peptide [Paeniglutamicibacter sulfureus]